MTKAIKDRLEYLRGELRAERISTGELHELQEFAERGYCAGDVELLEAAGVPEFPEVEPRKLWNKLNEDEQGLVTSTVEFALRQGSMLGIPLRGDDEAAAPFQDAIAKLIIDSRK